MKSIAKIAIGSKSNAKFAIGRRQWNMKPIANIAIASKSIAKSEELSLLADGRDQTSRAATAIGPGR